MKKIILPKYGNSSIFKVKEEKLSKDLQGSEVRVRVSYSGVNFADIMMRLGLYPDAPKLPFVPGYEISGIVDEVGPEVEGLSRGQEVIGGSYFGGYQSEVILNSWQLRALPKGLDLREGASLIVSFFTAYCSLVELARVRPGDHVLIDCATGSLGAMAAQLMDFHKVKWTGLTSSPSKKKVIEKRGGRALTHAELIDDQELYDVILNSMGGQSIKEHYEKLSPCGRVVCLGASSFFDNGRKSLLKALKGLIQMPRKSAVSLMNDNKGMMGLNVLHLFDKPEIVQRVFKAMESYSFKPEVDRVFPYLSVSEAHAYLEQKKASGKVLLSWGDY